MTQTKRALPLRWSKSRERAWQVGSGIKLLRDQMCYLRLPASQMLCACSKSGSPTSPSVAHSVAAGVLLHCIFWLHLKRYLLLQKKVAPAAAGGGGALAATVAPHPLRLQR